MADFHCSVKAVSRGQGRSATAAAAYRSASEIKDLRTGEVHNYTKKRGVEHSEIVLPADAQEWANDRATLWNAAEKAENRKDAKVAREWEVGLPHELLAEDRKALAVEYGRWLSDRYGIAVDVAVHAPNKQGDQRNHHAHLLGSTRAIGPEGFGEKTRILDSPRTSGQEIEACREAWGTMCNRELERANVQERVDHRSLAEQRASALGAGDEQRAQDLDRAPTEHLGARATAMERDGIATGRGDRNREIRAENAERQGLWQQVREWGHQVAAQARERARDAAERLREAAERLVPSPALAGGLGRLRAAGEALAQEKAQADRLRAAGEALKREREQQAREAERRQQQEQERGRQEAEKQRKSRSQAPHQGRGR